MLSVPYEEIDFEYEAEEKLLSDRVFVVDDSDDSELEHSPADTADASIPETKDVWPLFGFHLGDYFLISKFNRIAWIRLFRTDDSRLLCDQIEAKYLTPLCNCPKSLCMLMLFRVVICMAVLVIGARKQDL